MRKILNDCSYISLALNATTDNTDKNQLLICVRAIDNNLIINKEIFSLISKETSKRKDVYDAFLQSIKENGVDIKKISAICADDAPAMIEKPSFKNNINVPTFHCIVHQESWHQ